MSEPSMPKLLPLLLGGQGCHDWPRGIAARAALASYERERNSVRFWFEVDLGKMTVAEFEAYKKYMRG